MTATPALLACRLARRELRGGIRGLGVFAACLVLGVAAIAGIGSLAAAVSAGIKADARGLLGGDAEARLAYRPANAAERAYLEQSGQVSEIATLRAMARTQDGARRSLIELKAVDRAYPLYGAVALSPAQSLDAALDRRGGNFGAAVDPAILDRLGLKLGDNIKIGQALLQLRGTIEREPDASTSGIFGPRVIISDEALAATGLIAPGALVNYRYRLRLPAGVDAASWAEAARAAFPEAGWQIRTFGEASPELRRLIDRLAFFLSLVGLSALLVGGVGIGNAVGFFIAGKTATIATLKCLGASTRLVFGVYFAEIMALAVLGIAAALVLGALLPVAVSPLLPRVLPISLRLGVYPGSAGAGRALRLVDDARLSRCGRSPGSAGFRPGHCSATRSTRTRRRIPPLVWGATALLGLALAAVAVGSAQNRTVALWFVAGAIGAFALFRAAGAAVVFGAEQLGRPRIPALRLALANLHRPGAPTPQIVLSLGIGLTVLVAIALVEGNLAREVESRLPAEAPAFFFIDIQPDELAGFGEMVRATPGARFDQVPMMRGRITRLNGVPVEQAPIAPEAQWALRSDRGLTYAARLPAGSQLAAGSWWPPDYRGPPLVSFDADLARGMGLKVGDTLSVNLLGREITAVIANLRSIDWERLGINFTLVFAPGTLEGAPQTHLAAVYLPQAEEEGLVRAVTERFPNVTAIHVREALAALQRLVGTIGNAVRLTALLALAAGVLVLGGAIAAGHHRRVYEAVVLKVLGATRGVVATAFLIEHGLLGALSAVVASAVGTLAAYFLVTRLMKIDWVFLPGPLLWTVALATLLTLALGFAGTWRALGAKAAPYLRNE